MNSATTEITLERRRQAQIGWTPEHDDEHQDGELIEAALAYLAWDSSSEVPRPVQWRHIVSRTWPWQPEYFKPSDDRIRNLVKAGALIAAEIDRLNRPLESGGYQMIRVDIEPPRPGRYEATVYFKAQFVTSVESRRRLSVLAKLNPDTDEVDWTWFDDFDLANPRVISREEMQSLVTTWCENENEVTKALAALGGQRP